MPVITAVEPMVTRYGLWKAKRSQQNCVGEGVGVGGFKVVVLDFKKIQELLGESVKLKVLKRLLSVQSEIHWNHPPSPNDFLPRDAAQ